MSEIYIHYGNLEDSVKKSEKVRREITGYVDEIKRRITTPISELPGSDSAGYASTASSLAWGKINSLNNKANRFSAYESSVKSLISTAKTKDKHVSDRIETISGMYVEKRKWYQKAGDWIYNTFCVNLANKWDFMRDLSDAAKWISNKVGNALEPVVNWFKYGDGKYILNIVTSVVGAVVAVGGAILAVCSIPFTAGATIPIVIGCIGAVAASVGAVITSVNSVTSVIQNSKAISKSGNIFDSRDGDPSAARYYGSQTQLSTWIEKRDFGDKETNDKWEGFGKAVDNTEKVADTVSFLCNVAELGNVRDFRIKNGPDINVRFNADKWNKGYSFTYKNIKRNILHDMGFKVSKGKLDYKKAFNFKESIFATDYDADKFTLFYMKNNKKKTWTLDEKLIKLFKSGKVADNIFDINENIGTLKDTFTYRDEEPTLKDVAKAAEATTGLLSYADFFAPIDDYITKPIKIGVDIYEMFAS